MKVLKSVLIVCAMSAAVAHAQTAPSAPESRVAQTEMPRAQGVATEGRAAASNVKTEECVGPVSFCNIYFGS
ncbi:hypothetical protein P3T18_006936 [Paraburkholderia sp. GAS199]